MFSGLNTMYNQGSAMATQAGYSAMGSMQTSFNMRLMESEYRDTIKNTLKTANMSKAISEVQALGKFFKAAGDSVKSMAP
jgi:hypothetical protein